MRRPRIHQANPPQMLELELEGNSSGLAVRPRQFSESLRRPEMGSETVLVNTQ